MAHTLNYGIKLLENKMGLMPIIITALGIFIAVAAIILLVSFISYKLKPQKKPYIEFRNEKIQAAAKPYFSVPVYETPITKREYRPTPKQSLRYNKESRFEVLNDQKPIYMQSAAARMYSTEGKNYLTKNVYEFYSDDFNEGRFNNVAI